MLRKSKENFLAKHTAAVHISNDLTLVDRKIYNVLIKAAFSKLLKQDSHSISMDTLLNELGHNDYNNYSFIKESVKKLVDSTIRFNILGKDRKNKWESVISLLASAHFSNGIIYYSFPKELQLSFSKPNIYAYLDLNYQKKISSKYTIALWEFCTEQLDSSNLSRIQTGIISLDKLKDLMGANEKTYEEFKNFNRLVLKSSIKEINLLTDLEIKYNAIRTARKVSGITFEILRKVTDSNGQIQLLKEQPNIIDLINNTFDAQDISKKAKELNIDQETLKKLVSEFDIEQVSDAFDVALTKIKSQEKIKNLIGYIWKLLERGIHKEITSESVYNNMKQKELFTLENKAHQDNIVLKEFFTMCKDRFGEAVFRSWILHLTYLSHADDRVVFTVSNNFLKEWIVNNYSKSLLDIWSEFNPSTQQFIIQVTPKNNR